MNWIWVDKTIIEDILKENKEKLKKLERQKTNLIREITDARKIIERLKMGDEDEGEVSGEFTDSISDKSSQNKTPRSEDMVTIERLRKQTEHLEGKLKLSKKKFKDEKINLKYKIEQWESEIEEKNSKLKSLKDTLVEKFKNDIVKIYGEGSISQKLGQKEKEIELKLMKIKDEEVNKCHKAIEKEFESKIYILQKQLSEERKEKEKRFKDDKLSTQHEGNFQIHLENENKLKILRENKGTFTVAFDNNSPLVAVE